MNNEPEQLAPGSPGRSRANVEATDTALEEALVRALRPEMPSAHFVERVLAQAGLAPTTVLTPNKKEAVKGKVLAWPTRRLWIGGVAAAALLLGCFEGELAWHRLQVQQRRVANATAQFETTERVTVHALAQAREQLQRAGVPLTLD